MQVENLLATLQKGLADLGEDPGSHPCQAYLAYLSLLSQWNKAYNLTAIHGIDSMLTHHVLDSLAVLPYIQGIDCLDVGSGAGLPGLILALARPQQNWCLLDSNGKKVRFMKQALLELKISNARVFHSRIENYHPESRYSTIISRALRPAPVFYQQVIPLLRGKGRVIVMKGVRPEAELLALQQAGIAFELVALRIPGLNKQRHLVVIDTG